MTHKEAKNIIVKMREKVLHESEFEALDIAEDALAYRIEKTPEIIDEGEWNQFILCPICGNLLGYIGYEPNYCHYCGQKISHN